jgi:cytochrome c-type biogenesis protein CcmH
VIDFLTARYGEFVLLRPRFSPHTALLGLTPAATLVIGAFMIFIFARGRSSSEEKLTAAEQARVSELSASKNNDLDGQTEQASPPVIVS